MKTSKSKIFIMLIAGVFIIYGVISSGGMYCNMEEFFSDKQGEEDDACIAKLIKRADDGNGFAESRLRYPSRAYIKRVCEKGVENLGERERYYFERYQSCKPWGFKTPKLQGGEGNLTRAEGNNGEADTTDSKADIAKRERNSTEEQNAGR